MSEQLKPCPFCGSEAEFKVSQGLFWVGCGGVPKCLAMSGMLLDRQDMAIAAWNTRVHDTEVSVALARAAALQVTNVEQQQWILACEKAIKTSESRAEEIQQWYHQAEKRERLANSKMMASQLEMQKMQAERDAFRDALSDIIGDGIQPVDCENHCVMCLMQIAEDALSGRELVTRGSVLRQENDALRRKVDALILALEAARHEMICAAASGCVRLECVDKALAVATQKTIEARRARA